MTLSIIIPAYNRERFIEGCIRSLVAGGVTDTEILVVDDGSTDNTAAIVGGLCEEIPSIRLIKQENQGPGAARNTGAKAASGEWIWFIDSDDTIIPGGLPYVHDAIRAYPDVDALVISETWTFDDPSRNYLDIPLPPKKADLSGKEALRNRVFPYWCPHRFIFRRHLLNNPWLYFPEHINHEDEYFGLVLVYLAKRLHILDKSIYHYIQHEGSIMSSVNINNVRDYYGIFLAKAAFVDSDAVEEKDRRWLNGLISRWIVGNLRTFRGMDGYAEVIHPLLPLIRKEYNRRCHALPLYRRIRDNLRFFRARFRK